MSGPTVAGAPDVRPAALRRLETPAAAVLADLTARFEDLQTVLLCCERLVADLTGAAPADPVLVEAAWTTALLSYARCFATGGAGSPLTEDDLLATEKGEQVLAWHKVIVALRDHYADPRTNPREVFTVGVALDPDGAVAGTAITSVRQPLVDDLTVRQAGGVAFALRKLLDERIAAQQAVVFAEVTQLTAEALDGLDAIDVADSDPRR